MISHFYDLLLVNVIATVKNLKMVLQNLNIALSAFEFSGVETNLPFLQFCSTDRNPLPWISNIKCIENIDLPGSFMTGK
jgi:pyruvate carboxylase